MLSGTTVRIRFANLLTLPTGVTDSCKLGVSLTYYDYGGTKGYIYEPVSFVVGPPSAPVTPKAITLAVTEQSSSKVGEYANYSFSATIGAGFATVSISDFVVVEFPAQAFEGRFDENAAALCSLGSSNNCYVFGLANQIYIQPSAPVSSSSLAFTIDNLLNSAYERSYEAITVMVRTIVGNKVDAEGSTSLTKFASASPNITAYIGSIDSIYGGDAGQNYQFEFQLNSHLPENGVISITFPSPYTSLMTTGSACSLTAATRSSMGSQAYCRVIDSHQVIVVPNGVLLSPSVSYSVGVSNIINPNVDLTAHPFVIESFFSDDVYRRRVISRKDFSSPGISVVNVKQCTLQAELAVHNAEIDAQYTFSLICPSSIKEAS